MYYLKIIYFLYIHCIKFNFMIEIFNYLSKRININNLFILFTIFFNMHVHYLKNTLVSI